jgi:hypothetical protein
MYLRAVWFGSSDGVAAIATLMRHTAIPAEAPNFSSFSRIVPQGGFGELRACAGPMRPTRAKKDSIAQGRHSTITRAVSTVIFFLRHTHFALTTEERQALEALAGSRRRRPDA